MEKVAYKERNCFWGILRQNGEIHEHSEQLLHNIQQLRGFRAEKLVAEAFDNIINKLT